MLDEFVNPDDKTRSIANWKFYVAIIIIHIFHKVNEVVFWKNLNFKIRMHQKFKKQHVLC